MAVPEHLKFTYEDYLLLPEDRRYELIGGDFYVTPSPKPRHQRVSLNLAHLLWSYVRAHGSGEVYEAPLDVYLSRYDVVQPDVLFVRRENLAIVEENYVRGAPDLVIEILSESTRERDLDLKKKLYARHGVKEYWIADPDARTVTVYLLEGDAYVQTGVYGPADTWRPHVLPGLEVRGAEVFD